MLRCDVRTDMLDWTPLCRELVTSLTEMSKSFAMSVFRDDTSSTQDIAPYAVHTLLHEPDTLILYWCL